MVKAARGVPEVPACPGGWQAVPATPPPDAPPRAWTPRPPGEPRREDEARSDRPGRGTPHAGGVRDAPRRAARGGPAGAGEAPGGVRGGRGRLSRGRRPADWAHPTLIMAQHELRSAVL